MECYETCVDQGNKCAISKKKVSCSDCGKIKRHYNIPRDQCYICPSKSACSCALENLTKRNTCRCKRTCWQWFLSLFGLEDKLPECCKQLSAPVAKKVYDESTEAQQDPCEHLALKVSKSREGNVAPVQRFGARTRSFICERSSRTNFQDISETCADSFTLPEDFKSQPKEEELVTPEVSPPTATAGGKKPKRTGSTSSASSRGRRRKRSSSRSRSKKSKSRSASRDQRGVKKTSSNSSTGSRKGKAKKSSSNSSTASRRSRKRSRSRSPSVCSSSRLFRRNSFYACPSSNTVPSIQNPSCFPDLCCPPAPSRPLSSFCTPQAPPVCPPASSVCPPQPPAPPPPCPAPLSCCPSPPQNIKSTCSKPASSKKKFSNGTCCTGAKKVPQSPKPLKRSFSMSCGCRPQCCANARLVPGCCQQNNGPKMPYRSQSFHSTLLKGPSPVSVCIPTSSPCCRPCNSPCTPCRPRLPKHTCPVMCSAKKSRSCPRPCLCPIKSPYCSPPPCCRSCCPKPSLHPYVCRKPFCPPSCCRSCCKPPCNKCPPCCMKPCCLPCPRSFTVFPYCPVDTKPLKPIPRCIARSTCPCPAGSCSCPKQLYRPFPKPCCSAGCSKPILKPLGCTPTASSYIKAKQDDAVCQQLISKYSFSKPPCKPCPTSCFGGGSSCLSMGSFGGSSGGGGGCRLCVPCCGQKSKPCKYVVCDYTHSRKPLSPDSKNFRAQNIEFTKTPCSKEPLFEFFLRPHCIRKTGPRSPVGEFLALHKASKAIKRESCCDEIVAPPENQTVEKVELLKIEPTETQQNKNAPKKSKRKRKKVKEGSGDMNVSSASKQPPNDDSLSSAGPSTKSAAVISDVTFQETQGQSSFRYTDGSFNNNYGDETNGTDSAIHSVGHLQVDLNDTKILPRPFSSYSAMYGVGSSVSNVGVGSYQPTPTYAHSASNTNFKLENSLNIHRELNVSYNRFPNNSQFGTRKSSHPILTGHDYGFRRMPNPFPELEKEIESRIQELRKLQREVSPQRLIQSRPIEGKRSIYSPDRHLNIKMNPVHEQFIRDSWNRLKERETIREKEFAKMKSMGLSDEEISEMLVTSAIPEGHVSRLGAKESPLVPVAEARPQSNVPAKHEGHPEVSPVSNSQVKCQEPGEQGDVRPSQRRESPSPRRRASSKETDTAHREGQKRKSRHSENIPEIKEPVQKKESIPMIQSFLNRLEDNVSMFIRSKSYSARRADDGKSLETDPKPKSAVLRESNTSRNKAEDRGESYVCKTMHTSPPRKPMPGTSVAEAGHRSFASACSCQTYMSPDTSSTSLTNLPSTSAHSDLYNLASESLNNMLEVDVVSYQHVEEGVVMTPGGSCVYIQDRSSNSAEAEKSTYNSPTGVEHQNIPSPYCCGDLQMNMIPLRGVGKDSPVDLADYADEMGSKILLAMNDAGSSVDPVQTTEVSAGQQIKLEDIIQGGAMMFHKVEDNCDPEVIRSAKAAFFNKAKPSAGTSASRKMRPSEGSEAAARKLERGHIRNTEMKTDSLSNVMVEFIRNNGTPV